MMRFVQAYADHGPVAGANGTIFLSHEQVSMSDPLRTVEDLRAMTALLTKKTEALALRVEVLSRRVEDLSESEHSDVDKLNKSIKIFGDRMTELTVRVERLSESEREDAGRLNDAIERLRVLTLSLAERTTAMKDHLSVLPTLLEERDQYRRVPGEISELRAVVEENHRLLREFIEQMTPKNGK